MKFLPPAILVALAASARGAAIEKRQGGANSWAGSNLYFLHGLSDADQDRYINQLADWGAKVIRVWVTGVDAGCQKGSNIARNLPNLEANGIGSYDDSVLAALDGVLAKMSARGMKAIVSPHDGNAFGYNSCDAYCAAYGDGANTNNSGAEFYRNDEAKRQIDARFAHVLGYVSPSSGQAWGKWSDAILAFDVENEPFQQAADLAAGNDVSDWLCGRAGEMRKVMGEDSGVLIATGGIGGDQSHGFNLMDRALRCDAVDVMSVHAYVGTSNFWTGTMPQWVSTVEQHGKRLHVEEWGVALDYPDQFDAQAAALTDTGVPYTYWQMIPGSDDANNCQSGCCVGFDTFEVGFSSGKGNLQQAIGDANGQSAAQQWPEIS